MVLGLKSVFLVEYHGSSETILQTLIPISKGKLAQALVMCKRV